MPRWPTIISYAPISAIYTPLPTTSNAAAWATRLYADESFANFLRRLTIIPDGHRCLLLLCNSGTTHICWMLRSADGAVPLPPSSYASSRGPDDPPVRPKRKCPLTGTKSATQSSSAFIPERELANGHKPIPYLPGHKRASVAVNFVPAARTPAWSRYPKANERVDGQTGSCDAEKGIQDATTL
ncbi:unnamed protein product [Rhizoctonia solani]|uniref:Uncharacterized protein n=1 Tax=Rhizoctonia solani TaxID=456999 RepID=A0A8H3E860_9AGAM|nr:unnamed protein product [Rhizoctonia solani]